MKNLTKYIALSGLSIFSIAAMGQTPAGYIPGGQCKAISMPQSRFSNTRSGSHRVEGGPQNAFLDNVNGDIVAGGYVVSGPTPNFVHWGPTMYLNTRYTIADTVKSPAIGGGNQYTANSCTVLFDTAWDLFSQKFYKMKQVQVDTIWAEFQYANSSGKYDTVVFQVVSVGSNGLPVASPTIYGVDTLIVKPGITFPINSLDSIQNGKAYTQVMGIVPNAPIVIPNTARRGWNFAITMKVIGSKSDTIGVNYYSSAAACTSGSICNAYTFIGVPDSKATTVNSFISGCYWYNDAQNHGNGTSVTWPTYSGPYPGYCMNSGNYYFFNQLFNGCTDTAFAYWQDIAIYASVSFLNTAGINEVSSNGLTVSQNYPNPFNQQTQIKYNLTKSSNVVFTVYDLTGRQLVNTNYNEQPAGDHYITINANQLSSGIYFYSFNVNGDVVTQKMIVTQ